MSTRQQEHVSAVKAISGVLKIISDSESERDALKHCYALIDAAIIFIEGRRGREAAYNFVQGRADEIITPGLAK